MAIQQATPLRQRDLHVWPRYEAAALGFRNYWYPVTWSRELGRKPRARHACWASASMLLREQRQVVRAARPCPHRGIPLSLGRQEFPGTWSLPLPRLDLRPGDAACWWPRSPTGRTRRSAARCGRGRTRSRSGRGWSGCAMGDGPPRARRGRHPRGVPAAGRRDRGADQRAAGQLALRRRERLRRGPRQVPAPLRRLWTMFRDMPAWSTRDRRAQLTTAGVWRAAREQRRHGRRVPGPGRAGRPTRCEAAQERQQDHRLASACPAASCSQYATHAHYEWYVPVDGQRHRYLQFLVTQRHGLAGAGVPPALLGVSPLAVPRPVQRPGRAMVEHDGLRPGAAVPPDSSITAWRRLCEHARGEEPPAAAPGDADEAAADDALVASAASEQG